jgi:hypothetical protein
MQLFKVEVGEVQKTGTLAVLVSKTKPFTKIYVRVFYSSRNDKIRRVNKFNILNVKDLLKTFIRTFTSRKFAFMSTILIPCVEESGLGGHDLIMFCT